MGGGRRAELDAARPERIVVVRAVEAVDIPPDVVRFAPGILDRSLDEPRDHDGAQAELADGELQVLDRLRGRVHRDRRGRRDAVRAVAEDLGAVAVERAARGIAQRRVLDVRVRETGARVDHGEVDAELGQALVQQCGQGRGGQVERILGRRPERRAVHALAPALLEAERFPATLHAPVVEEPVAPGERDGRLAAREALRELEEPVLEDRLQLEQMPVGVDHRVTEAGA